MLVYVSTPRHTHIKHMCNQDFAKIGAWKLKFFCLKNTAIGWRAEQRGATQLSHKDGGLRAKPLSLGDFLIFREKITISTPFGSHFAHF